MQRDAIHDITKIETILICNVFCPNGSSRMVRAQMVSRGSSWCESSCCTFSCSKGSCLVFRAQQDHSSRLMHKQARVGIFWPCYRGHLGPSGPKVAKRARNEFPGPLGPGGLNSPKQSRKRVNIVQSFSYFASFLTPLRLLWTPRGREVPGTHVGVFWLLWARRAQSGQKSGQEFLQGKSSLESPYPPNSGREDLGGESSKFASFSVLFGAHSLNSRGEIFTPQIWGEKISPLEFGEWAPKSTEKQANFEDSPPKSSNFACFLVLFGAHSLNSRGEIFPKFGGG